MKSATLFHAPLGFFIIPFLAFVLALAPLRAPAQVMDYQEPYELYSREELAQMLAPVALYPDALLAQVLMASTYPIEVIEADRWVRMNPHYTGEALDAALLNKNWDPSVKAICHFPSILAVMSERISETTDLGNAFLAQEAEVMGMVQELRAQAYAQGNLTTTSQQQIIVEKETIIIQPVDHRVIYVPYYDPFLVYGSWWYPAYPPYYWGPSGARIGYGISYWPGVYFGFSFGTWSYFDWHRHIIYIDVVQRPRFVRQDRWLVRSGPWQHAPIHRRGVAYRDRSTAIKFGQTSPHFRETRRDTQRFSGDQRPDHIRRGDGRTVTDRNNREADRTGIERDRQQRQRSEPARQERAQSERNRQQQQRSEPVRQERAQSERNRQQQQWSDRDRQERERVQRARQEREQAERNQQGQQRIERERQEQQQVVRDRQVRQQAGEEQQLQVQVERERPQGRSDQVFNQVETGNRERQSNSGRIGRQDQREDSSRDRGRSGGDGQGGDDRGRRR
jgi:hypothetical protein